MLLVLAKYAVVLVAGGAGGFLYGGKVEAKAQAEKVALAAAAAAVKKAA